MALEKICWIFLVSAVFLLLHNASSVIAGDIVHDDDSTPKKPSCNNKFVLVKVQTWVDGREDAEFVGMGARFGRTIESEQKNALKSRLVVSHPREFCSTPKNKMICEADEALLDIDIPAVLLPKDAGTRLEKMLMSSSSVFVQLYSPRRPVVDVAEAFLWLMAVGTILCASYWSAWRAREAANEKDKLLKDAVEEMPSARDAGVSGVVNINTEAAVLFVVAASCFLFIIYKLMSLSLWFIEVLVALFCIGVIEGLQICLVALLSKCEFSSFIKILPLGSYELRVLASLWWFKRAGVSYVKVPFFGAISYLTFAISPFCITFSILWAVYRNVSFARIGQDILGIALIITVLQIVHIPNLKVGTVLLSCALIYDLFWVFVSQKLFNESVMIMVAQRGKSGEDGIPMLLKFPRFFDPWGASSIIGLEMSFYQECWYDWLANKNLRDGYFLWAILAYGFGLLITYVALNLMDGQGQPALLYIVPFTLGSILTLGHKRGDLRILWTKGEPERPCPHIRLKHYEKP